MTSDRQERSRQATCRRVLVVDDEEWMRDAVGQILQPEGFEVITASDGPSGLELAKRHSPDLDPGGPEDARNGWHRLCGIRQGL